VAGALPDAERAAIANHAAVCDQCHALIEGLVETGTADETLPGSVEPPTCRAGHAADVLEPGRGSRAGPDGASAPPGLAPGTPEFSGTDRFAVVRRIGAGGMGVVYEVWDREREAPFALKTLRSLSPRRLSLFKNEFRALRGLSHRNLVTLALDAGDPYRASLARTPRPRAAAALRAAAPRRPARPPRGGSGVPTTGTARRRRVPS